MSEDDAVVVELLDTVLTAIEREVTREVRDIKQRVLKEWGLS